MRDAVTHARDEVDRLSVLAEDLLLLADAEHRVQRDVRQVSLADLVEQSVRAHRGVADGRGIDLHVELADESRVCGEPGSLRRVVDNLLGNALAVASSRVAVSVGRSPGATLELRVDDDRHRTGAGGAGLGLASVAAVAAAHRGVATAENHLTGARVTVRIPVG